MRNDALHSAPTVSVVLPFFNAASTLGQAIASIREQTFADWELIAFDDGSEDGSAAIAARAASEDPRIRLVSSSHVGIVDALRRGCAEAGGTYIARMDADDRAYPERLAAQVALLEAHEAMALCGTRIRMTGTAIGPGRRRYEAWINHLVRPEDLARDLFIECPLPHPTFMMRRQAYQAIGGYQDHGWAEDYDLVMRFWRTGCPLGKVPRCLLDWHDRPGRLSMTSSRYGEGQFRKLKRHYLFASYLQGDRPFYQWGAGEVGKRWLREWRSRKPLAAVDINPRKIGGRIHDVPIIAPEELPPPGSVFTLVMVGAPGARQTIREWFGPRGYREGEDYLFLV